VESRAIPAALDEFAIAGVLGEGGSSVVYAGRRDGEDIALKVLRDEIALTDGERRRFLAEADRLARVSHPGVIRVLGAGLLSDGRPYLVLPRLRGEPLAMRLARERLTPDAALALFYQATDAVVALHAAGLLHRDLKPENFFLEGDRLVLLDFGIAREPDGPSTTATQQGHVRGTPAYMAPERFFNEPASERSEVYELAVTLHVMLTGALPWPSQGDLESRVNPAIDPALSPALASVLRKALASRVEVRPASVADLVAQLRSTETVNPVAATITLAKNIASPRAALITPQRVPPARSRRRFAWAIGALAIAGLGGLAIAWRHSGEPGGSIATGPSRSVLVLLPRDQSGGHDHDWLATAISEQVRLELEAGGGLATASSRAARELSVGNGSAFTTATAGPELLAKVRASSHAEIVVTGSFLVEPDQTVHLAFLAQDANTGVALASSDARGSIDKLSWLVSRAAGELRNALGGGSPRWADERAITRAFPDGEAARLYAQGLERLRHYDGVAANELLTRAAALAPDSPLVHDALAQAWHASGRDSDARVEAARARELGADLPEEQRLVLTAHAAEYAVDWPTAETSYATLWQRWPDNVDYGLGFAEMQSRNRKLPDAFRTLDAVRKAASATPDARIDLIEAQIADRGNDFAREAKAADRAAKLAETLREPQLEAAARRSHAWALETLGQLDEAKRSIDEAIRLFGQAGDRNGTAGAVITLGTILEAKNDLPGARRLYEDGLRLAREIGNRETTATALLDLGQVLSQSGDPAGARGRYEEALVVARAIGNVNLIEDTLINLGALASRQDDLVAARAAYAEALKLGRAQNDHRVIAVVLINTSNVDQRANNIEASLAGAQQAVLEARKTELTELIVQALINLATKQQTAGQFEQAQHQLEEVIPLTAQIQDRTSLYSTQTVLVGVLLDRELLDEAEKLATKVLASIDEKSDPDDYGWLQLGLSEIAFERHQYPQATRSLERAKRVVATAGDANLTAKVQLSGAAIAAMQGQIAQAKAMIAEVRKAAAAGGIEETVLFADLTAAHIDWELRHDQAARDRLTAIAKAARAKNLVNVALQAERAAR
jgi:tetratricopeptide (TPR) repeat protein/predicted Ser/Thr protein kinase